MNSVSYNPKTLPWRSIITERQEAALFFSTKYALDWISQQLTDNLFPLRMEYKVHHPKMVCSIALSNLASNVTLERSGNKRGAVLQLSREVRQATSGARRNTNQAAT